MEGGGQRGFVQKGGGLNNGRGWGRSCPSTSFTSIAQTDLLIPRCCPADILAIVPLSSHPLSSHLTQGPVWMPMRMTTGVPSCGMRTYEDGGWRQLEAVGGSWRQLEAVGGS